MKGGVAARRRAVAPRNPDRINQLRKRAKRAWETGDLFWRLHDGQAAMIAARDRAAAGSEVFVTHIGRQWGKSYGWFGALDMLCRALPGASINYFAATKIAVKNIVIPNVKLWFNARPPGLSVNSIDEVLALQCPHNLRPKLTSEGVLVYPNESSITFAGTENDQLDRGRGPYKHMNLVDEAGFIKCELPYLVESVLDGQYTHTHGNTILNSTSPSSPVHPFKEYALDAQKRGAYFRASSLDNPMLTQRTRKKILGKIQKPGAAGLRARIEYFPVWATDPDRAILPEATPDAGKVEILEDGTVHVPEFTAADDHHMLPWVQKPPLPAYALRYWSIDPGNDEQNLTGLLAGYYDFQRAKLVITAERLLLRPSTAEIRAAYHELWTEGLELIDGPIEGRSDVDLNLIRDLNSDGIPVWPAEKHNKFQAVNKVRDWFKESRIEVWPGCKNLITQICAGTWKRSSSGFREFDRLKGHGHFDLIDCLVYMVRHINEQRNPAPWHHGADPRQVAMLEAHGVVKKSSGSVGADLVGFLRSKG